MRIKRAFVSVAVATLLAGCKAPGDKAGVGPDRDATFLTVDFEPGQTLRYTFVSDRAIALDWDPNAESSRNRVQEQSERLEMVIAYTPVEVDPYGVSAIQATCESVEVTRSGGPGARRFATDAVAGAQGKTFALRIDSRGKMVDASDLEAFIQDMGKNAFRPDTSRGRIKEPDMIGDFVASQWFLWDAVSSIDAAAEGVAVGRTWPSKLLVPTPMVMRRARDVTYRLAEIRYANDGKVAVIESTYALAESVPSDWPVPYSGRFQMSGTFGFLGAYKVSALEGGGVELFDIDAGRVRSRRQTYTMKMRASLPPMGIRANPHITIKQTLTMELMSP